MSCIDVLLGSHDEVSLLGSVMHMQQAGQSRGLNWDNLRSSILARQSSTCKQKKSLPGQVHLVMVWVPSEFVQSRQVKAADTANAHFDQHGPHL